MTKLAEQAWAALQELDDREQDRLAEMILEDIESERKWDDLLATPESQKWLEEMGNKAREDHLAGRTEPLIPDEL